MNRIVRCPEWRRVDSARAINSLISLIPASTAEKATKRAFVKLSGYAKFARAPYPYDDVRPYVDALLDAFTPDGCLWATDWPFLRAHARLDVGPLLALVHRFVPDAAARRRVLWQTPCRVLGFSP